MEGLFSQEVITQIISLLQTAADGSVSAIIVWLLIPVLLITISSIAWLWFGLGTVKFLQNIGLKYFDVRDKEANRPIINPIRFDLKGHMVDWNVTSDAFKNVIDTIKESDYDDYKSPYLHDYHLDFLKKAINNQLLINSMKSKKMRNSIPLQRSDVEKMFEPKVREIKDL